MMQRAMHGLVAEALGYVAEHGLPGDHHFYISFITPHPGVDMPDWLREQFPEEMMIVLQHEYDDLAVADDRFSVSLSFQDRPATLVIPYEAVLQFADPSAEFGLRFDPSDTLADLESDSEQEDSGLLGGGSAEETARAIENATREQRGDEDKPPGEVVELDAFRKK
ncbi:MAG: hypothetical protein KTR21_08310 [Rhodobacteraceae bacterium]|nr:hypothetical protein [Paracoccaceae bacterium]